MEKFYIYKLIDPITYKIRYIGKTNNIARRFSSHLNDKSKSHKTTWINSLKEKGILPIIEVIETFSCEKECYLKEIEYIKQYDNLTNHQAGGIGGDSISTRGINNPNSNLNDEEVLQIRDLLLYTELSIKNIALKFNVSIATIHGITSGNSWSYLTNFTGKEKWTRGESIKKRADKLKDIGLYDKLSKKIYQYTLDKKLVNSFKSISDASSLTKTNRSSISQCINNKLKTANNFIWTQNLLEVK